MANFSIYTTNNALLECLTKIQNLEERLNGTSNSSPPTSNNGNTNRLTALEKQVKDLDELTRNLGKASIDKHNELVNHVTQTMTDINELKTKLLVVEHESKDNTTIIKDMVTTINEIKTKL